MHATLVHLVEGLGSSSYSAGIAGLDLVHHWPDAAEEVVDPGGGDVDAFIACAERVVELVAELAVLL